MFLLVEVALRRVGRSPVVHVLARLVQGFLLLLLLFEGLEQGTGLPVWNALGWVRQAMNIELANLSGTPVTPMTAITVLAVFVGSWSASSWSGRAIATVLTKRNIGDAGTIAALARLGQYMVMGVGVAVGLNTLGLNLSALFAAGAVFAVGIGLAMQQIAENFVSGVILLVERTIRPGDVLEVGGDIVRVQHLGIRSTVARTLDDEEIILPNSKLVQNEVKNLRLSDAFVRVRVPVGVSYDSDLHATLKSLERAASVLPDVPGRPSLVVLLGFGSSSVDFEVSVWTPDPWSRERVVSALSFAIWDALKEDGIVIAYPQLDVHLDFRGQASCGIRRSGVTPSS